MPLSRLRRQSFCKSSTLDLFFVSNPSVSQANNLVQCLLCFLAVENVSPASVLHLMNMFSALNDHDSSQLTEVIKALKAAVKYEKLLKIIKTQ